MFVVGSNVLYWDSVVGNYVSNWNVCGWKLRAALGCLWLEFTYCIGMSVLGSNVLYWNVCCWN